uniref:Interferon-related developmental regulator (IFRD) n=1 Tax=Musca domestica TaxID=7370 RepID=T1PAI1_MUSDO
MISDEEIAVNVDMSYETDLINGTIRRVLPNITNDAEMSERNHDPFEVLIQIYGYKKIPRNVHPRYILNRGQNLEDLLKSNEPIKLAAEETLNLMHEDMRALENSDEEYVDENNDMIPDDIENHSNTENDSDEYLFSANTNKVIQLGERQEGDYLLYQADQSSPDITKEPTNHTVVFYFIDSSFVTCVEFLIIDHYLEHPLTSETPHVEFEKISAHSLKAIVTDPHTTSLFVQMHVYGFEPNDKPVDFKSYLNSDVVTNSNGNGNNNNHILDDVEDVHLQLSLTAKRRTRVHFHGLAADDGAQVGISSNWWLMSLTAVMIGAALRA